MRYTTIPSMLLPLALLAWTPLAFAGKAAPPAAVDLRGNVSRPAPPGETPEGPPLVEPDAGSPAQYELFDLTAIFFSSSGLVTVTGQVRNLSEAPVRGHVMLHFRSATDQLLYTSETEVNQGQPFAHGAVAAFEATITVGTGEAIRKVSVAFIPR